jgi:hypothetical protein
VTGEWRKVHNEEFRDLYSSASIIRIIKSRRMRWTGHVACMGRRGTRIARMGENKLSYRLLVGKPEGKRPLVGLRRKWVNNIKMSSRAFVNAVMILRVL